MVNSEPVKPAFDTHASSLKNDNLEALLDFRFRVGRAYLRATSTALLLLYPGPSSNLLGLGGETRREHSNWLL
jgi:hypothetical protein